MNGVLNIYKPQNMTSHDVVAIIRRTLGTKKVGHTGTLDPMATGVLPICVGRATKIVDFIQNDKKTYHGQLTLGITTDTEDCWGNKLIEKKVELSDDAIRDAFQQFIGDIEQVPPMYSALKVNGKKLYELARAGKTVERKARVRTIYALEILKINGPVIDFSVTCSKGTYIRTLCKDIGDFLGVGGHMSALVRTATGKFNLDDAIHIEDAKAMGVALKEHLLPVEKALTIEPTIKISKKAFELIQNGVKIDLYHYYNGALNKDDYVMVYHEDLFVALSQFNGEKLIVSKLFEIKR